MTLNDTPSLSIRDLLEPFLPPILFCNNPKFREWTGYSPQTVLNEDAKGTGPRPRIFCGRSCGYPKEAILNWLETKIRKRAADRQGGSKNE